MVGYPHLVEQRQHDEHQALKQRIEEYYKQDADSVDLNVIVKALEGYATNDLIDAFRKGDSTRFYSCVKQAVSTYFKEEGL